MSSFTLDISKFLAKAQGNADAIVRKEVLDMGVKIVERSPVGNPELWKRPAPKGYVGGRFRGNWQYGNDATGVPTGELPDIDPSGAISIGRITAGLPLKAAGLRHTITNNLPYAMRLETGWSKQAPGGMVGISALEFRGLIRRVREEVVK